MGNGTDVIRGSSLVHEADGDVLARACAGDADAFAETYRRYRTRIYGFCLARLLSRELAEDATQETFLRLYSADTTGITNPRAWLFTVARNVCTDTWRQRGREHVDGSLTGPAAEVGTSPDAAEELRIAQDTRNGLLALRRMRPRYRAALILREIHGLPVPDIAESMGIGTGAAHTLISRARDSFAHSYAEVSGRPESCMDSLALIYAREGRTLTSAERDRLDHHLEECGWCRDQSRVTAGSKLTALMPFMVTSGAGLRGLMARIGQAVRPIPEPLRDVGGFADAAAHVTSRVVIPLLVTASVAVGAFTPGASTDVLAPLSTPGTRQTAGPSTDADSPREVRNSDRTGPDASGAGDTTTGYEGSLQAQLQGTMSGETDALFGVMQGGAPDDQGSTAAGSDPAQVGPNGQPADSGSSGTSDSPGAGGTTGSSGSSGTSGTSGSSGDSGSAGSSGAAVTPGDGAGSDEAPGTGGSDAEPPDGYEGDPAPSGSEGSNDAPGPSGTQ